MPLCEKSELLNELIKPMGFIYCPEQDIFTSSTDAWQRQFGYRPLFDKSAPVFQMVFDCEPVYFDYEEKTWLIELWKGQYGINTGAEIGIYHADTIVPPSRRKDALFHAVSDQEMLDISMKLSQNDHPLFELSQRHWWLTGFCMGRFSKPESLCMRASITFPDFEMMQAFVNSLINLGYSKCDICICHQTVSFTFFVPFTKQPRLLLPIRCAISQWKNRLFCKLYLWITRPFCLTLDRLLYLYYFLPFAFRKMVTIRIPQKHKKKKNNSSCKRAKSCRRRHR